MPDEILTDDKNYCESIARSIADIIRFSLNEEFRKNSCELFGVFSTNDTEKEISKRLLCILQNSKKPGKKSKKNKENVQEPNDISNEKTAEESSSTDSATHSQNSSQRNWLQISSEKYRDVVKRKKLQFHSQPCQSEFEFPSCNTRFNNSQPASSSFQLNGGMESSLGGSQGETDFCKKRFKESFGDAGKYLKRNLKYSKRIGF